MTTAFQELADRLRDLPIASAVPIARAFAQFLTLANIAEQHHRVRRRREYAATRSMRPSPVHAQKRSRAGARTAYRPRRWPARCDPCASSLCSRHTRPRSFGARCCRRYRRIGDLLAVRDRSDLTPEEHDAALDDLRREIATIWQTEEVRDRAVSPLDEVRSGLAVFEQTLWEALPRYMRQIDRAMRCAAGARCDTVAVRIVDWRRSRRKSERDAGDYPPGGLDGALGGRRPVCAGDRRAARGTVDRRRLRRIA